VFGANEVKAVVVAVDTVVNVDIVDMDILRLDDAYAVIRAVHQGEVPDGNSIAMVKQDVVGSLAAI
jgi:hypothetical protein